MGIGNLARPIFVIADMHLGHRFLKLREGKFTKPEGDEWENKILRSIHKIPRNVIYVDLGDISVEKKWLDKYSEVLQRRPDLTRILVIGNHDEKSHAYYYGMGFDFVCETFSLERTFFSHRPTASKFWPEGCLYNVHGHLHDSEEDYGFFGNPPKEEGHVLVATEILGPKALHLSEVLSKSGKQIKGLPKYKVIGGWVLCNRKKEVKSEEFDTYDECSKYRKEWDLQSLVIINLRDLNV